MPRIRKLSEQARLVLAALLAARKGWTYGYELCRQTGVKSGTLYPLLMRLEEQGHLEAEWREPSEPGRPPRHAYRLTARGVALAQDNAPVRPASVHKTRKAVI
jgi:PadR family transcriptional regulator, regulatory protein PadR